MREETRKEYLDIDEFSNALDSLEKAHNFLENSDDSFRFKWVSLSLTTALYGFMICALSCGNPDSVIDFKKMKEKDKIRLRELAHSMDPASYSEELKIKETAKLIPFHTALERIQQKQYMELYYPSKAIDISKQESKNVLALRQMFRNRFEHYSPMIWAIEHRYVIPLVRGTAIVTQRVLSSSNLYLYRDNIKPAREVTDAILVLCDANEASLDSATDK